MLRNGVLMILILASVYADPKDDNFISTTRKTPALNTRFFGLDGIFDALFQGHHHNHAFGGFGDQFPQTPYPVQQNPQPQNDWENIQSPQQFPSQEHDFSQHFNSNRPSQSMNQGKFNPGNNFGSGSTQYFNNDGTLDEVPSQHGVQQSPFLQNQIGNQMGLQNQNSNQNGFQDQNGSNQMGLQNQNNGNQMGFDNQNGGNQMVFENPNGGNQMGFENPTGGNQMGFENPNGGNQMGFENQNGGSQMGFENQNGGNQTGVQNQNQQGFGENDGQVAILGKPVTIPPTSVPDRIIFEDGSDTPAQIQCVQDCQSTTEYDPVCASNNITYFNPGRFICARNCGLSIFLSRAGRCFD